MLVAVGSPLYIARQAEAVLSAALISCITLQATPRASRPDILTVALAYVEFKALQMGYVVKSRIRLSWAESRSGERRRQKRRGAKKVICPGLLCKDDDEK
jgi:hypothetical protein